MYRKIFSTYPKAIHIRGGIIMKIRNWVKFIILSILVFVVVLCITYGLEIWNAILAFPLDRVISFILGAAAMFFANFRFRKSKKVKEIVQEDIEE